MAKNGVTLEHVKNYFSLSTPVQSLDVAPTATGGLGIDNRQDYPRPTPYRSRITRGTEYVKKELDKERQRILEKEQLSQRPKSPFGASGGLGGLDDVSTLVTEIANCNEFDTEAVHDLYAAYYATEVNYNQKLEITQYRERILQMININRAVVIQGNTGCGKTTQVPQYILDYHAKNKQHCNIIVTQPRKIAAISIARRVCQERKWSVGKLVGYKVGLEDCTSQDTRLTYVTTGVLRQKLIHDHQIKNYTHVIIDEVHERDIETDFVLLIVKKLVMTNSPHVKVIVMSATINTSLFANYFSLTRRGDPAPIIEIPKIKGPIVDVHYMEELCSLKIAMPEYDICNPRIPDQLYDLAVKLMYIFDKIDNQDESQNDDDAVDNNGMRGAVLIFLPGYEEIATMTKKLKPAAVNRKYTLMPLHSTVTIEEQAEVFRPPQKYFRKVIISTNIAESSITVPDIKFVIDFCLTKNMVCEPETNYSSLKLEWASKSNCEQRKGRCGRVFHRKQCSKVYRLIPESFYDQLPEYGIPEMKRSSLTQLVLHTKTINIGEPLHILALAMDPPEMFGIEHAILMLKQVGALTLTYNDEPSTVDGHLTFVGRVMSILPLDVKISRLIILGYCLGYLEECIIMAASLSLRSFLAKPFQLVLEHYKSALSWSHGTYSDCLIYLHAYRDWKKLLNEGQFNRPGGITEDSWGRRCFIQIRRIKEVDRLVKEIKKRLEVINMTPYHYRRNEMHDTLLLKLIIAGAFFPNFYVQDLKDERDIHREISNGDVYSSVYLTGLPANHGVLYYHAIQQMMGDCSTSMSIEFEERKAYIQFDRRVERGPVEEENTISTIHPSVFYAVKMRLMRIPLVLQTCSTRDAERRMEQLRRIQNNYQGAAGLLTSKRLLVQPASYNCKRVDLPPIGTLTVNIFITHLENPGRFWVRYAEQENNSLAVFIENTINPPNINTVLTSVEHVTVGALVLAPYDQMKGRTRYYRATIETITFESALVFYIDFGNSKYVPKISLREISYDLAPDVHDTPALAFTCQLSEVKPSSVRSFQWTPEACEWFREITAGKTLNAKVYSVVQDQVRLELIAYSSNGQSYSINQELINRGFAERAEESLLSREDYTRRMKYEENMQFPMPMSEDQKPFQLTTTDLMGADPLQATSSKTYLRGPYSPLEVNYYGINFVDQFKSIKVDSDSVNSVSLTPDTADKNPQVLVAASVSLNQRSDSICLRSTTLMPGIKGLQSLLCLVFAPYVEYRADRERKAYIGALCGLGYDPKTKEPVYPDHDIETTFDVTLDHKDIVDINAFRIGINVILGSESEYAEMQKNDLLGIQEKLRTGLLNLVTKKRIPREPTAFSKPFKWNQVHPDHVLNAEIADEEPNSGNQPSRVFSLHNGIVLINEASLKHELLDHIRELYNIASKSLTPREITCRLCSVTLPSPRILLIHLDSAEHKKKEEMLKN